jgi:hypothetical protein
MHGLTPFVPFARAFLRAERAVSLGESRPYVLFDFAQSQASAISRAKAGKWLSQGLERSWKNGSRNAAFQPSAWDET